MMAHFPWPARPCQRRASLLAGWALVLAMANGAEPGIAAASELPRGRLTIESGEHHYVVTAEIARDARARSRGLMQRRVLAADAGMLFVYSREQPSQGAFWMYNTLIPLSIAFLGDDGEIRAIEHMPPCRRERSAECPTYPAGVPFNAALEVNAGYFEARGVEVGDRVALPATP